MLVLLIMLIITHPDPAALGEPQHADGQSAAAAGQAGSREDRHRRRGASSTGTARRSPTAPISRRGCRPRRRRRCSRRCTCVPNKVAKYEVVAEVMASAQRLGLTKIGIVGSEQFINRVILKSCAGATSAQVARGVDTNGLRTASKRSGPARDRHHVRRADPRPGDLGAVLGPRQERHPDPEEAAERDDHRGGEAAAAAAAAAAAEEDHRAAEDAAAAAGNLRAAAGHPASGDVRRRRRSPR